MIPDTDSIDYFEWVVTPTVGNMVADPSPYPMYINDCSEYLDTLDGFRCLRGYTYAESTKSAFTCLPDSGSGVVHFLPPPGPHRQDDSPHPHYRHEHPEPFWANPNNDNAGNHHMCDLKTDDTSTGWTDSDEVCNENDLAPWGYWELNRENGVNMDDDYEHDEGRYCMDWNSECSAVTGDDEDAQLRQCRQNCHDDDECVIYFMYDGNGCCLKSCVPTPSTREADQFHLLSVEASYQDGAVQCQEPSGTPDNCAPPPCSELTTYPMDQLPVMDHLRGQNGYWFGADEIPPTAVHADCEDPGDGLTQMFEGTTEKYNEGLCDVQTCMCNVGHYGTVSWDYGAWKFSDECETTWFGYWVSTCSPCDEGEYESHTGSTECHWCELGTYEDHTGSTECSWCEVGTYEDDLMSTECSWCPPCLLLHTQRLRTPLTRQLRHPR
jgi:hypothetical protein